MMICRLFCFLAHLLSSSSWTFSVKAALEMYILTSVDGMSQLSILHSICADIKGISFLLANAPILLWHLFFLIKTKKWLFRLVADLSITFKAFSSHSSEIVILVFLCLLAGMICCCYYSLNQAALVNKVAPAQDITSLCCWQYFLSRSYCPGSVVSQRDRYPDHSGSSSHSGMLNLLQWLHPEDTTAWAHIPLCRHRQERGNCLWKRRSHKQLGSSTVPHHRQPVHTQ